MPEVLRPNLFNYATSELSQDAFICWLAEWANLKYSEQDEALHQTGREFVLSMIRKVLPDYKADVLRTVKVTKQAEKLDVLIEVNEESDDKLAILVEDKTHTSNHSDQLSRYYRQVASTGYTTEQMIPLYFKTGYQSRFDIPDTYQTYLRKDFLNVLQAGKEQGVSNAIYNDFLENLTGMDNAIKRFTSRVATEWTSHDWIGFYSELYDRRKEVADFSTSENWGYVANPSGGFHGYWWYFKLPAGKAYMPYLQLEQETLCFKIEAKDKAQQSAIWKETHQAIMNAAALTQIKLERPKRMKAGNHMTVARWPSYLATNRNGFDFENTLINLGKAQAIVDAAFRS